MLSVSAFHSSSRLATLESWVLLSPLAAALTNKQPVCLASEPAQLSKGKQTGVGSRGTLFCPLGAFTYSLNPSPVCQHPVPLWNLLLKPVKFSLRTDPNMCICQPGSYGEENVQNILDEAESRAERSRAGSDSPAGSGFRTGPELLSSTSSLPAA